MPAPLATRVLERVGNSTLGLGAAAVATAYAVKVYAGGRTSIWEREWGGKMIMILAPPTPTTLALIHHLLHLPSPPQILYLPPLPSPLPSGLLTLLHALRLSAGANPLAQLHCEALPPTPRGVREFVRKWTTVPYGTAAEDGRRIDAIVLGDGWSCIDPPPGPGPADEGFEWDADPRWTPAQMQFHFITALLPSLLRAPAERNIRIVSLVSPGWTAALPGLQAGLEGKAPLPGKGPLAAAARRGATSLLLQTQLCLILDTLASASYSKRTAPDPTQPLRKRDESVQSNILALGVVMPWARDEVMRPVWGEGSTLRWILYILLLPFILLLTPSPAKAIQPVLFALSAPVKYAGEQAGDEWNTGAVRDADELMGTKTEGEGAGEEKVEEKVGSKRTDADAVDDPRRDGVRQGDVVRDCGVIDIPPVLRDPLLARATYEKLETEVEAGVKASEARERERLAREKEKEKEKEKEGGGS